MQLHFQMIIWEVLNYMVDGVHFGIVPIAIVISTQGWSLRGAHHRHRYVMHHIGFGWWFVCMRCHYLGYIH